MSSLLKYLLYLLLSPAAALLLYGAAAFILGMIPVNRNFRHAEEQYVEIFIASNGVHTDIIVPLKNDAADWTEFLSLSDFSKESEPPAFAGFGWGDKGFYLETPSWSELKADVALKAVFWPSDTAMHVTLHSRKPAGKNSLPVKINVHSYKRIAALVKQSFQTANGRPQKIVHEGYPGMNDAFYEAEGYYHLFYTCNSWTGETLKKSGIRAPFWSPFDRAILSQIRKIRDSR